MAQPRIATGIYIPPQPPLGSIRQLVWIARLFRLDSVLVWDHFQDVTPQAIWDEEYSWFAAHQPSPHAYFDYQVLLGYLAPRAGGLRLGVGVTEPIRRHPVLIAQAMLTLAQLTRRAPILGLGAGERENTEPYGFDFARPVGRLEEALQIIRQCFIAQGPFDFRGEHFRLNRAVMDLQPPPGKTPELWVAAHGPRMLRLTGRYADGWYPSRLFTPDEYAARLGAIREAARAAGRAPDAITPALTPTVVLAPTEAAARTMLLTRPIRFTALLISSADDWRRYRLAHPFGASYRGYIDLIPEDYDRKTLDEAIAAVPADLVEELLLWGTPDQVVDRLRALGEAGLRHVVVGLASALVSQRALFDTLRGLRRVAARLRSGR